MTTTKGAPNANFLWPHLMLKFGGPFKSFRDNLFWGSLVWVGLNLAATWRRNFRSWRVYVSDNDHGVTSCGIAKPWSSLEKGDEQLDWLNHQTGMEWSHAWSTLVEGGKERYRPPGKLTLELVLANQNKINFYVYGLSSLPSGPVRFLTSFY